jgi:soluble P-type ATPase
MFEVDIHGFGLIRLEHLVSEFLSVHILTADTFGRAREELEGVNCLMHILKGKSHDVQKAEYVEGLGAGRVVAFGNWNNDRRMLKTAALGIAVTEGEGCAVDALKAADIHVGSAADGLGLLLNPKRCKATLRF